MRFLGKTVIVTGGTSGIGQEAALQFAKSGASVAVFGTNEERARVVIEKMEAQKVDGSQKFLYFLVDVSKTKEVEHYVSLLIAEWGHVDILINNAGITKDQLLMRMCEEDWDSVIDVNLKSIYNTCRVLARPMMKQRSGKIINISSVVGIQGNAGQTNYAASKAGMIGFTKSLAQELASRNICVNCIAPGYIQTQMTEQLPEQVKAAILSKVPLARMGQPEDVAYAILFLASDQANYITGQVLTVDGGMVM